MTTETAPDGASQNIVYTNFAGEVMLKITTVISDSVTPALRGKQWITYDRYDGQGRLIEEAEPSAVIGYDANASDLMDFSGSPPTSPNLAANSGLIHLYTYGQNTTATTLAAGEKESKDMHCNLDKRWADR